MLEAVQRLRPVAEEAGLTMAQLALAWVLRQPNVASAIVGASRPEQVHANASASGIALGADTLAAIDDGARRRRRALGRWPAARCSERRPLAPPAQRGCTTSV